jgi:hypothetical protein
MTTPMDETLLKPQSAYVARAIDLHVIGGLQSSHIWLGVWGLGFRVWGSSEFSHMAWGLGFGVWDFGVLRVLTFGLVFVVWGLGFRVWGSSEFSHLAWWLGFGV